MSAAKVLLVNMNLGKVFLATLTVLAFYGLQVSSAPAQGASLTALQLIQSELSGLPHWKYYLPDEMDANNDGELSEDEVGETIKSYMRDVFNQLDKDGNQVLVEDEVRNISINVDFISKIADIAFKSYPIKKYLGHADRNQDGFISEDDFYLADNNKKMNIEDAHRHCGGDCDYDDHEYYNPHRGWRLVGSIPTSYYMRGFEGSIPNYYSRGPMCADSIGEKEAQVLCRELGYIGVQTLTSVSIDEHKAIRDADDTQYYEDDDVYKYKFECQGSEENLDFCTMTEVDESEYYKYGGEGHKFRWRKSEYCPFGKKRLASVTCVSNKDIGPVHLAGGKDPSMGEVHIGDKSYQGAVDLNMAKVVCRQLGFNQGIPKILNGLSFFNAYVPKFQMLFKCNGSEANLADCPQVPGSQFPEYPDFSGIICNPGGDLEEKYGRMDLREFEQFWESYGRNLFVADANGDEKVSVEELKAKVKELLESMFHLLDQTNDGSFSVEDFSTLNLRLSDVIDVTNRVFQVLSGGKAEFNPNDYFGFGRMQDDLNSDGRLTWKEIRPSTDSSEGGEGLLGLLVKHLDINQDGLWQSQELEEYIKMIFNNLDVDGSSTITLEDVFNFIKKSQFTCLQIEGVRTFVEGWMDVIGTQLGKLLEHLFAYLDLDSSGEIPLDEFYNLPICNRRPEMEYSDLRSCGNLEAFFYFDQRPIVPKMDAFYFQKKSGYTVQEKMINSLCIAMQPDF